MEQAIRGRADQPPFKKKRVYSSSHACRLRPRCRLAVVRLALKPNHISRIQPEGCAHRGASLDARDIYARHLFVPPRRSPLFTMAFQATPTDAGVYRVKVYDSGTDSYWRYMTDASPSWIKRTDLDASSDDFKVRRNMTLVH